ncbi:MAG TPA: nucleotidyl transferase AbiEii/AbiGii toxin family protein [Alicyclobacillus sp.]|nr:nucleotidyl transferase AbiEii/AbiGii toxin family protein [Alicyclobacillus sp.]
MYWDRIDAKTGEILKKLRDTGLLRNFYLSGGTALALQLGHRISVDLDFFTKTPQSKLKAQAVLNKLVQHFGQSKVALSYRAIDQLWVTLDGVKVTCLAYPFPRKYPLVEYEGIFLADAKDIALQKAFSIGRRATARDYVDLAWIVKSGVMTLLEIAQDASEIFVDEGEKLFSEKVFLQQLVYTEDLEDKDTVVSLLHVPYDFDSLMQGLQNAVEETARQTLMPDQEKPRKELSQSSSSTTTCTTRCQTSKAPVSSCRCGCGGKNHGTKRDH